MKRTVLQGATPHLVHLAQKHITEPLLAAEPPRPGTQPWASSSLVQTTSCMTAVSETPADRQELAKRLHRQQAAERCHYRTANFGALQHMDILLCLGSVCSYCCTERYSQLSKLPGKRSAQRTPEIMAANPVISCNRSLKTIRWLRATGYFSRPASRWLKLQVHLAAV